MSDERSRKRERDARAWGVELTPNDVLLENVRAGRWIVLHPTAISGNMASFLSQLGGPYLGFAGEDAPQVPSFEGDIVWHTGFADNDRAIPVVSVGTLYNNLILDALAEPRQYHDRLTILGIPVDEARHLQEVVVVWPLSDAIRKERLDQMLEFSEYMWKLTKKSLFKHKHAALFFRNGDLAHLSCFQEASKPIDSRWRGRSWNTERYRWPKGRACDICGGKTIKPKQPKRR